MPKFERKSIFISGAAHGNQIFRPTYRMICGSILLIAVVTNVAYSAIYTSQIAVTRYQVLVKLIGDVATNPDIKVYITRGSPTINYILVRFYCFRNILE